MKYNLKNIEEVKEAKSYFKALEETESIVEIIKKHPSRSYNQNNYLHLLLSYTALFYGESKEYFKEFIWKRIIAADIFETEYVNKVKNEKRPDWRSSSDLTTDEMRIAIDKLIMFASKEMGLELPHADQHRKLRHMENEIEKNKVYL